MAYLRTVCSIELEKRRINIAAPCFCHTSCGSNTTKEHLRTFHIALSLQLVPLRYSSRYACYHALRPLGCILQATHLPSDQRRRTCNNHQRPSSTRIPKHLPCTHPAPHSFEFNCCTTLSSNSTSADRAVVAHGAYLALIGCIASLSHYCRMTTPEPATARHCAHRTCPHGSRRSACYRSEKVFAPVSGTVVLLLRLSGGTMRVAVLDLSAATVLLSVLEIESDWSWCI